jgi:hypothetical protein
MGSSDNLQGTEHDAKWTPRLLARKVVERKIVEFISHESIRRTFKRTASQTAKTKTGMEEILKTYALPYDPSLSEEVI